jgi:tRNA(fMet)-specific endonuclease VapC
LTWTKQLPISTAGERKDHGHQHDPNMRYLLDSDWIINLLAGRKDATDYIQRFDPEDIGISLVTAGEIYESAFRYANPQEHIAIFRSFLEHFQLLNLNLPIVEKFAEVRAHLRRQGQLISDFDMLLGATALHYDLTVLTYNRKHFSRIPDIKIHQV